MTVGDELYQRIGSYGIGNWLADLLTRAGQDFPAFLRPGDELHTARFTGFVLTFGRITTPLQDPRDEIVLLRAEGDRFAPMPFRLSTDFETVESATQKLSADKAGGNTPELEAGDRRVSFFMGGGSVVELRFTNKMRGFDRILMAQLGVFRNWGSDRSRAAHE